MMRHMVNPSSRLAAGLAALSLLGACNGGLGGAGAASPSRLAERSADAGDFQTAATLYQQAFDADPTSVEALVGLGRAYAGLGQFSRAEQALNEANRRRPRDPEVLLELARTALGAGQPQAALADVDLALARRPKDIRLLTAKGIALDRLSRHAEAQEIYRAGLQYDPTDFALLSNLGLSLGLSGQTGEGITILRELARDPAAGPTTRGNLALVYGLAGQDREAAAVLATDLGGAQVKNNLAYYRELRSMLLKGKPIGGFESAPATTRRPVAQATPVFSAPELPTPESSMVVPPATAPVPDAGLVSGLPAPATPAAVADAGTGDSADFVAASAQVTDPAGIVTTSGGPQ